MIRKRGGTAVAMGALVVALLLPTAVAAQDAPAPDAPAPTAVGGKRVFVPADFARFAPRTAADMLAQVPGFAIVSLSNGGNRGLGAATENVLFDGERIAGKATDARTQLARTPADQVVRIEIVDGTTLGIPGLAGQVANIVTAGTGFVTTFKWNPEFRSRLDARLTNGEISTTGKVGGTTLTVSLANDAGRQGHWGPEVVRDAAGTVLAVNDEFETYTFDEPRATVSIARKAANGNRLNASVSAGFNWFDGAFTAMGTRTGVGLIRERGVDEENERNAEWSADYEFALGKGRLKVIGLQRMERSPTRSDFVVDRAGAVAGNRFTFNPDENESILRGEYSWKSGVTDWQVALEGAYNSLDAVGELYDYVAPDRFVVVPGTRDRTKVTERRVDGFLSYSRPLASNLTIQATLGAEYSELQQAGVNGLSRRYVRPKGKVALSWKASPKATINYELQHRVDQLDFFDFASTVDLANNSGNAGNARIVPPQITRTQLEFVRDLDAYGKVTFAIAAARQTDVVDFIPIGATGQGRGNLPEAWLYRAQTSGSLLLDPWGWKGAKIDFNVTLRRNRVRDPLLGNWRDISGSQDHAYEVQLRHDVAGTQWAWGAVMQEERYAARYRLNERRYEYASQPFVVAFVEHKDVLGLTVRASVKNLLNQHDMIGRAVWVQRRDGPLAFTEDRDRRFGRWIGLSISGKV